MHPAWWTLVLLVAIIGIIALTSALFTGSFKSYVPVTVISDRAGLVMDRGGKVKMRGVQVGRVAQISDGKNEVSLKLEIYPDQIKYIPANVPAGSGPLRSSAPSTSTSSIRAAQPEAAGGRSGDQGRKRRHRGQHGVRQPRRRAEPDRPGQAQGRAVRAGRGPARPGRSHRPGHHRRQRGAAGDQSARRNRPGGHPAAKGFSDTYGAAAQDILRVLDAASAPARTVTDHSSALDSLLSGVIGLSRSGINLVGPSKDNLIRAVNALEPTTSLLMKYNPELTCMLVGAKTVLDTGYRDAMGGANGYSLIIDSTPAVRCRPIPVPGQPADRRRQGRARR